MFINTFMRKTMKRINIFVKEWVEDLCLIKKIWKNEFPKDIIYNLTLFEKIVMSALQLIKCISLSELGYFFNEKHRHQFIEWYVFLRLCVLCLIVTYFYEFNCFPIIKIILLFYFLINIVGYSLCIVFVDSYDKNLRPRSRNRSLILLIINYIEIIIAFAALYLITNSIVGGNCQKITERMDAIYFSVVSITTLGYGDFTPINLCGKILIISETLMGLIFIVLVLATFLDLKKDDTIQIIKEANIKTYRRRKYKSRLMRKIHHHHNPPN